ncbi:ADP-ribosylglycohydrolase family protein [Methylocapsa acidiphila]|uniref:ADP-ribosylglycohydrolase family protein n=1 Tax=Methylocapsa acidiphila TaxID=133552 RepID=UPI001FD9F250|nr:ADP-ribosylglycohydrolase family protein [Methylocapsa acidiphila]
MTNEYFGGDARQGGYTELSCGGEIGIDRAIGAMLGLTDGDALGATLEFSRRDSNPEVRDILGGAPFRLQPGEWTDDITMTPALFITISRIGER